MREHVRSSVTDPLRIATVQCGKGQVGLTFCPGKCGDSVFGAAWKRDLALDLQVIREWGARIVLTLVEEHELHLLQVSDLGEQVRARGMEWHHLPIPDLDPPGLAFEERWQALLPSLKAQLAAGGKILVHCRGGLGRAGTVAACLLVEMGDVASEAIRKVRSARPRAIETSEQQRYVLEYQRH